MIYFIEAAGAVKIGRSNNPKRRLQMIATGSPVACSIIGVMSGDASEERDLHDRFSKYRVRREWFELSPEVKSFIAQNTAVLPADTFKAKSNHPLSLYLQDKGESLSAFAKTAKTSRMQLYRIMAGEGTTTSRLKQISAATGGELSVADLVSHGDDDR
jgi:hypothetical protein